jgi:hypothetical protein
MKAPTRIAFLTNLEHAHLTPDDRLVLEHLDPAILTVEPALWDDERVDWKLFDAIVVRSPWDYSIRFDRFRAWLSTIETLGIPVHNPIDLLRWNYHKFYLRDLRERGFLIPDTLFIPKGSRPSLKQIMNGRSWKAMILKPAVSAAARNTHRLDLEPHPQALLDELSADRDVLLQEFREEIRTQGEWSFIFFWNEFSHSVIKRPGNGDFRVQTYYGGSLQGAGVSDDLIAQAGAVVRSIGRPVLYARVDALDLKGRLCVMELEAFEPSLYLGAHQEAPRRFAGALGHLVDRLAKEEPR